MGRPLAKRFFGNRNIGTSGTGDNKLGGEGIASINWSQVGSFRGNNTSTYLVGLALPAPTLPGGVQAEWTLAFEVESVSTGAGKTDLAVGDTFGNASFPGMIAKVTSISGSNAVFAVTGAGASRGSTVLLGDLVTDTTGVTLTKIAGTGTAATFLVDINYRIKTSATVITEKGSGYTGAETFTVTLGANGTGTAPAGTIELTTDSGAVGSSTNQENAIIIRAKTTSGGTGKVGDIVAQKGSHRYKVKTADGTAVCKLVTTTSVAVNQAYVLATDITGNEYYVTKITSRKCIVVRKSGGSNYEFADPALYPAGQIVKWTFGTQVLNKSVKIENA